MDIDIPCISRWMQPVDGDWAHSSSRSDRSENRQFRIYHSSSPAKVSRGHDLIMTQARINYDGAQPSWAGLICHTYQHYRRQWLPNNEWS